jgi:outer membrane lipoprotein SlyB
MKKSLLAIAVLLIISGCAKNIQSNVYNENETTQMKSISKGVILEVIPVTVEGDKIVGTASGAVIGGISGSMLGGNDTVKVLSGAVGALIGSGVGRTIDGWITGQEGYQYIIELRRDGEIVSIVQGANNPLAVGDNVLLLHNNDQTKVIKNTTVSE